MALFFPLSLFDKRVWAAVDGISVVTMKAPREAKCTTFMTATEVYWKKGQYLI
jgi:hypothetical protein